MHKRRIKWEKFHNPIVNVNSDGESDSGRVMVMSTPFGVEGMKYNPDFPEEKVFIAHCNFDIDKDIFHIVDNTEGVEIVEVYSPYRMRITIGKAFYSKKVRRVITSRLCDTEEGPRFDPDKEVEIFKQTAVLRSQNKPWLLYILPNGQFESCLCDNEQDLENKILLYNNVRDEIGGIILTQ